MAVGTTLTLSSLVSCELVSHGQLNHLHAECSPQLFLGTFEDPPEGTSLGPQYYPYREVSHDGVGRGMNVDNFTFLFDAISPYCRSGVVAGQRVSHKLLHQQRLFRIVSIVTAGLLLSVLLLLCVGLGLVAFLRLFPRPLSPLPLARSSLIFRRLVFFDHLGHC